jgi:hypothetical protein
MILGILCISGISPVLCSAASAKNNSRWFFIQASPDNTRQAYMDTLRTSRHGDIVDTWTKWVNQNDTGFELTHNLYNCRSFTSMKDFEEYGKNGAVLKIVDNSGQVARWAEVPPDSIGEGMLMRLCSISMHKNRPAQKPARLAMQRRKPARDTARQARQGAHH